MPIERDTLIEELVKSQIFLNQIKLIMASQGNNSSDRRGIRDLVSKEVHKIAPGIVKDTFTLLLLQRPELQEAFDGLKEKLREETQKSLQTTREQCQTVVAQSKKDLEIAADKLATEFSRTDDSNRVIIKVGDRVTHKFLLWTVLGFISSTIIGAYGGSYLTQRSRM